MDTEILDGDEVFFVAATQDIRQGLKAQIDDVSKVAERVAMLDILSTLQIY